jgi:ABC-2 type transport system ATP-binding protein
MGSIIKVDNVSKHYSDVMGQRYFKALDNFSLEVNKGEIFGLLGPNGSGKTTLLKLLLGLIFPTKGGISVLGKSPRDIPSKMKIGYLPEHPYFYDFLNPVELLNFYGSLSKISPRIIKERIPHLIEKVGLGGFEKMRIRNFSKGMLQRVGLAASLINDPELLFLDEPTLGLDPIGTLEIQRLLRELNSQGKTIFLSSHLLAQVQDSCQHIAVIHQGKLIKTGRLEELLTVKEELAVIVRGMGDEEKDRLKEFIEQSGAEVLSISKRKGSLKDIFIKIINEEKKG